MPVTAAQVGEGMTKAASVMEMAGATIEEAAGMITGGGAVTQDFNAFGNALKVSALRIRGKTFCLHTRKGCMLCA